MSYNRFNTVDWVEDAEKENRVRLFRLQKYNGETWQLRLIRAYSACQSWVVLASAGALIGVVAVVLDVVTGFLADLREGRCTSSWYLNKDLCCFGLDNDYEGCADWVLWSQSGLLGWFVYILISAVFATIACFLVLRLSPFAAGSGISEIKCIVAGFILKGFLGLSTLVVKSIALPFTIASGLSVGKEGPSVHYAACAGNVIGRLFPKYRQHNSKRAELLTACTAAGVAVAFGSPIGGVLFSLEEISATWELSTFWRSYFCCLVATSVLTVFNPFRNGKMVLFSVEYDHDWHWFELPFFIVIGLFGGFMGHFIIKYNLKIQAWRKKYLTSYPMQEVLLITIITAMICYFNQFLIVDMTKSMEILFHECSHKWEHESCDPNKSTQIAFALILAIVIRTALLLVSYGAKVPAGIFVPSMAIGALFGRLIGTGVWALQLRYKDSSFFSMCPTDKPCVDPGSYAFLGAGALLSGVMHITITVVIIMFELTGALKYIIPTMIVVGITTFIAQQIDAGGIADQAIVANGYPYFMEEFEFEGFAEDVMTTPDPIEVYGPVPAEITHSSYPIVDHQGFLIGSIEGTELEFAANTERFDPNKFTVNASPIIVNRKTDLSWVHEIFVKMGPRAVFVVEAGTLLGLITRKDLLRYWQENHQARDSASIFEQKLGEFVANKLKKTFSYSLLRQTDEPS